MSIPIISSDHGPSQVIAVSQCYNLPWDKITAKPGDFTPTMAINYERIGADK
jgi:hypothetical protein